jgi:hypothetical protein
MRTLRPLALSLVAGAVLALAGTAPALAQEGATAPTLADHAALEAALTGHERAADRTRAELADLLAHESVQALAEARGIDLDRVAERAATLSDEELAQVAPLVAESSAAMAQNRTITISVYTIIIFLLILILIT